MTSWIGILFDKLYLLWPFRIVHSYQQGVRFWLGVDTAELGPGCYVFCPFFGSIEIVNVVPDVMNLPTQSVTTTDGRMVTFSANIAFEIASARKMFTKVQDFRDSLDGMAMGSLASRVRVVTWDALQSNQDVVEDDMKAELQKAVKKWGVKILSVHLTDMVEARQWRLFGDPLMH